MTGKAFFPGVSYAIEAQWTDTTDQAGAIDTLTPIKFGPANTSTTGIASITAAGVITVLKRGPIFGKTRIRVGRAGAAGVSYVIFYTQISVNGGSSWIGIGSPGAIQLNNSTEVDAFFDFSPILLGVGTLVRQVFARDSSGNDSGDLHPFTPSATLQSLGIPTNPSAQLTIYRDLSWSYS